MHAQMNSSDAPQPPTDSWPATIVCLVAVLVIAHLTNRAGLSQKWHPALVGTVIPFQIVLSMYRRRWASATFWFSVAIVFAVHCAFLWFALFILLVNQAYVGIFMWLPITVLEYFVILAAIGALDRLIKRLI